jgi:hypothetical protein
MPGLCCWGGIFRRIQGRNPARAHREPCRGRQLGVTPRDRFQPAASFTSIPDIGDRFFRSALLVDGAYAPKN